MGVAKTALAGKEREWPDEQALALRVAIQIVRKEGYTCQLPPDDYDGNFDDEDEEAAEDPELAYLQDEHYADIEVMKGNESVFIMTSESDWIYIRCATEAAAAMIEEKFVPHFALGRVRHEEKVIPIHDDLAVSMRTGNAEGNSKHCSVGTVFELKKGEKVICKALCSYSNAEMDASGPTIELLETAKEWQGHGYAKELLTFMEQYFEEVFEGVAEEKSVKFNVCYCTNGHACEWFLGQGFRDWDGMGEELGKFLFE
jgi:GNAT superfamily N-acetyltransferase